MSDLSRFSEDQSPAANELVAWLTNVKLTARQAEILKTMRDAPEGSDEAELVYEKGAGVYLGCAHVAPRTLFALLRMCAISADPASDKMERYRINGTGRQLLDAHEKGRL